MPIQTTVIVSVRFTPNDHNKKVRTAYTPSITDAPKFTHKTISGTTTQVADVLQAPVITERKRRPSAPLLLSTGVIKSTTMILTFNDDGSIPVNPPVNSVYGVVPTFFPSINELIDALQETFDNKADCKVDGGITIDVRDTRTGARTKPTKDFQIGFHEQLAKVIEVLTPPVPASLIRASLVVSKKTPADPSRRVLGGGRSKHFHKSIIAAESESASILEFADELYNYSLDRSFDLVFTRDRKNVVEITQLSDSRDRRSKIYTEVYPIDTYADLDNIIKKLNCMGGLQDTVVLEANAAELEDTVILEKHSPAATDTSKKKRHTIE